FFTEGSAVRHGWLMARSFGRERGDGWGERYAVPREAGTQNQWVGGAGGDRHLGRGGVAGGSSGGVAHRAVGSAAFAVRGAGGAARALARRGAAGGSAAD